MPVYMNIQSSTQSLTSIWQFFRGTNRGNKAKLAGLAFLGIGVVIATAISVGFILKCNHAAVAIVTAEKSAEVVETVPSFAFPYEINDISVAVSSRDFSRTAYAQFSLVLDCPSAQARHLMELNRARLLDGIFEVSTDFRLEDLTHPGGLKHFKALLEKKYRKVFQDGAPRQIALNDWLIQ